jgi:hypothetical protein
MTIISHALQAWQKVIHQAYLSKKILFPRMISLSGLYFFYLPIITILIYKICFLFRMKQRKKGLKV